MKHDFINHENQKRPRSGGPQTPEGRERSSANAKRHGVLSEKIIVLQGECMDEYNQLKRDIYEAARPVGFFEDQCVREMLWAKWRQMRAMRAETAAIDDQMDRQREYWREECPTVDSETRIAHGIKTLVDESNDLQHLSRYETRFHRMYHRALSRLLELQERRLRDGQPVENTAPAPAPEPEKANLPNEQPSLESDRTDEAACGIFTPRNIRPQRPNTTEPVAPSASPSPPALTSIAA